jgi:hypothetical protein
MARAQDLGPSPAPSQFGDGDTAVDQPIDFSALVTAAPPSSGKLDPSKFTPIVPSTGWSAKVGVNSAAPTPPLQSGPPLPETPPAAQSGPAWANVTAPSFDNPLSWDKASIETRVDPLADESKLGVTFSRSMPIGGGLSVTLQNGYSITQAFSGAAPSDTVTPGMPATASPSRELDTNQALKLSILPSDTSLSVGATRSSTDAKWLPSLRADQKLFGGPISISGSVSQTTTGELQETVTGGFRHTW